MDITDAEIPEIYVTDIDAEGAFIAENDEPKRVKPSSSAHLAKAHEKACFKTEGIVIAPELVSFADPIQPVVQSAHNVSRITLSEVLEDTKIEAEDFPVRMVVIDEGLKKNAEEIEPLESNFIDEEDTLDKMFHVYQAMLCTRSRLEMDTLHKELETASNDLESNMPATIHSTTQTERAQAPHSVQRLLSFIHNFTNVLCVHCLFPLDINANFIFQVKFVPYVLLDIPSNMIMKKRYPCTYL
ncbi:hypothetical protein HD806DRAFT_527822 [Xylariaceae sp. AK1471]|nr:hypothetical protein HD806DRAFT_527822 [Xylariaceae sp. AK1471]